MPWYMLTLLLVIFVTLYVDISEACSCLRMHPQDHYCKADFVILARIKQQQIFNDTVVYKARIKKYFKTSEKAEVALKSGRLLTARSSAMCGSDLLPNKVYVLSGKIIHLKARINLCNMAMPWRNLTRRQRKGLNMMYRQGCHCKISQCYSDVCARNSCGIPASAASCYAQEGICLPSRSKVCRWGKNAALTQCVRKKLTISW